MPTNAVIQLSKVGSSAFTATIGPQLSTEDIYHAPTTGLWGPSTGHRFSVHRAGLIVSFESISTLWIVVTGTGYDMTGHLLGGPAYIKSHALRLLCANRMQKWLCSQTLLVGTGSVPNDINNDCLQLCNRVVGN